MAELAIGWRFYLWVQGGVLAVVFEVELELKREQSPAPAARSESK
jgi:hypothetical protein